MISLKKIKRLIPNSIKQEGKYILYDMLKMPYSRSNAPLEVMKWLPTNVPITFFDIGANVGDFSKCLCGEYKVKKGVLVEPVSKLIPELEKNFPDKKVFHIINAAISDSVKETDFYVNTDAEFVSSLLRIDNKGDGYASLGFEDPVLTKVQALTLDHLANDLQISDIDLIKIDVQGAEHLVLQGGIETLKRTKLVYTEFSLRPLYKDSSTFFNLYNIFYENNFMLTNISGSYTTPKGELLQGDALFVNKALMG
jgi:FkbM family methyltransferase